MRQNNSNGLLIVAGIGLFFAGMIFLIAFITTQKAKTPNPRSNLLIPVPFVPEKPALLPLPTSAPVIFPTPTPILEESPPATDTATPISTPSASPI